MKTTATILAFGLMFTGCTIDRRTIASETVPATPPATENRTTQPPKPSRTNEDRFIEAIYAVHTGPIYVNDQDLIDAGWGVCEGVAAGATAQDMIRIAAESSSDDETFMLLMETSIAAVMFLCPEYEYILDDIQNV